MVFPGIVALTGVDRFRFVILWETWIYHHAAFRSSAPWWLCRADQESAKPRQKTFDRYAFRNSNYLMHNHFSEMLQSDTHLSQPPESIDLHSPQGCPQKSALPPKSNSECIPRVWLLNMNHVTAERAAVLYTRAVAKRAIYQIVSVCQTLTRTSCRISLSKSLKAPCS